MEKGRQNGNLVSSAYVAFFSTLLDAPIDVKRCFDVVGTAISKLVPELPIGKVVIKVDSPPNRILRDGEKRRQVLYEKGEVETKPNYNFYFETDAGDSTTFEVYTLKNSTCDEQQIKDLDLVIKQLYVFIGRARSGTLLSRTLHEDGLTGIPNLTTFYTHGSRLIEKGKLAKYDAFYFNVRDFRYINRMLDYQGGDQVMIQYAHEVCDFLIEDEMVARLGGDNYVALIRRDRTQAFLQYLKEIEVEIVTAAGKQMHNLRAVCGIYEIDSDVTKMSEVMTAIGTALQAAKQSYKQEYVYYTPELSERIVYEKMVAQEFVENMQGGKFITYLQPKFDLSTNSICGAEALARWNHKGKVVNPEWFIPMLEKDGAVCMLDFEILRQACKLIAQWKSRGKEPVRISINLSNWNLHSQSLVEDIMEILDEYQVEPKYIEIELTETMDSREYAIMADLFRRMKECGLTTSLDNFGLGFSSLNMIKDLDVDVLKLDKKVIADMDSPEGFKSKAMIENIIDMAKTMDMKVLAEGVETMEQRNFLIEAGCDVAQGYLYAAPMQADEFERRVFL